MEHEASLEAFFQNGRSGGDNDTRQKFAMISNLISTNYTFRNSFEFLNIRYKTYTRTIIYLFFSYFRWYDSLFLNDKRLTGDFPVFIPGYIEEMLRVW